eukprot:2626800-Alexandrium_andersonii.AAC.1
MTTQRAPGVPTCSIRTRPSSIGGQTFGNEIAVQRLLKSSMENGGRRQFGPGWSAHKRQAQANCLLYTSPSPRD